MCVDYDPSARTYATSPSPSLSSIHMSDPSLLGPWNERRADFSAAEKLKAIMVVLLHFCLVVVGPFLLPLVDRRLPPSLLPPLVLRDSRSRPDSSVCAPLGGMRKAEGGGDQGGGGGPLGGGTTKKGGGASRPTLSPVT